MRFVWAVAAFFLAAILIGTGIAQRTVFHGADSDTAAVATGTAPYLLIDGTVMSMMTGTQTLDVSGDDGVVVAYGRTGDLTAWLSDQEYTSATVDDAGAIATTTVEPEADAAQAADPTDTDQAETDATTARSPQDSDLWLGEYDDPTSVQTTLQIPAGMSVLVASDGSAPAPDSVTISWPRANATPWAGPLIVLGGLFLVAGIALYVLGIRHARRSRGPRRKAPPPLEATQPIDIAVESADKGVIAATPARRGLGRRRLIAAPLALVVPLVFTGCSADAWPQFASSPDATTSTSAVDAGDQQQPAVTQAQAQQIVQRISDTVAQADANLDADLAATRLGGAALAARQTNYTLRSSISDYTALAAIPAGDLQIVLPQAYDDWPRTVLAVADTDTTSTMMMLTQDDPWSNYKLVYVGDLGGSTELPALAPVYIGAAQVPPDSTFLAITPDSLAAAYADVLTNGANSTYAALFDEDTDTFSAQVAADRQTRLDEFNSTASSTGSMTFGAEAGSETPLALATLASGAIVAVTVNETDTVTPLDSDVVIKFDDNPTVKALTGASESQTGVTTTFVDQLFFYVPAQGSTDKIRMLGYSSSILSAKVIS
ncbi:MAG: glycosyl transferase [Microbacterium sp.]|uniref:glycosyl transferase n=1 Tax=Microbacterium sp. TaxID=51671 RepID=UPI0039E35225